MTNCEAQEREYDAPRAWSIRSQNSVCLISGSSPGRPHPEPRVATEALAALDRVDGETGLLEHLAQRPLAPEREVARRLDVAVGREAGTVALLQRELEEAAGAGDLRDVLE